MKNKKLSLILIASFFSILIYFIIDKIYFLEFSKIFDVEKYGYFNSLIVYEKKILILFIILFISIICSLGIIFIFNKREKEYNCHLELIKKKLENLSNGDYFISIDEIEELGPVYDELHKLIVKLRERSEIANKDKVKIKESLENIYHQVKTPLASIEILLELKQIHPGKRLQKIDLELSKINTLISNLLTLAKIDVNQIEFQNKRLLINEILYTSIDSLNNIIKDKKVEVLISGEDFFVKGDFYWLVEAFINIIKNSIEYCKSQVKIELNGEETFSSVIIMDNGPGFSDKDLVRIFDRFYQVENNLGGVGIGLNMAKNILEKHNATIKAENNNGGIFIIKFYT